ncbi:uncharacterized protein LOC116114276 [Pistacia vera]|uniref:uncharacterized protein LOC116114276 n=1 Tax=Pistacia vera TaxID=55513 RepID=UPI00126372FE|nr:uncharacterized protein LOC116114276 [Pistacia vera]
MAFSAGANNLPAPVVVVALAIKKLDATGKHKSAKKNMAKKQQCVESQDQIQTNDTKGEDDIEEVLKEFMEMILDTVYGEEERSWASPDAIQIIKDPEQAQPISQINLTVTEQCTPFKQLLEFTPNQLVIECDKHILIRAALAEKYDEIEEFFSFPQLLASSIFALIQSASEIAAVVSPYGAIVDVFKRREKYSGNGEDVLDVSWWFKGVGGFAAAMGFFLCGWRLTQCLGGKLTFMSNSRGLASQLSTVAAIIIVTQINLPVSSVHAFVGSLVGVG